MEFLEEQGGRDGGQEYEDDQQRDVFQVAEAWGNAGKIVGEEFQEKAMDQIEL